MRDVWIALGIVAAVVVGWFAYARLRGRKAGEGAQETAKDTGAGAGESQTNLQGDDTIEARKGKTGFSTTSETVPPPAPEDDDIAEAESDDPPFDLVMVDADDSKPVVQDLKRDLNRSIGGLF